MNDRWLSVDQIAEYLGVSRDTIYAWLSHKKMPGHRVGHLWKFKRGEVDGWVRAGGASNRRPRREGGPHESEAKQQGSHFTGGLDDGELLSATHKET